MTSNLASPTPSPTPKTVSPISQERMIKNATRNLAKYVISREEAKRCIDIAIKQDTVRSKGGYYKGIFGALEDNKKRRFFVFMPHDVTQPCYKSHGVTDEANARKMLRVICTAIHITRGGQGKYIGYQEFDKSCLWHYMMTGQLGHKSPPRKRGDKDAKKQEAGEEGVKITVTPTTSIGTSSESHNTEHDHSVTEQIQTKRKSVGDVIMDSLKPSSEHDRQSPRVTSSDEENNEASMPPKKRKLPDEASDDEEKDASDDEAIDFDVHSGAKFLALATKHDFGIKTVRVVFEKGQSKRVRSL